MVDLIGLNKISSIPKAQLKKKNKSTEQNNEDKQRKKKNNKKDGVRVGLNIDEHC